MLRFSAFLLLVISVIFPLWAQEDGTPVIRPVTSAFMLEGGCSHIVDTYLTPLKYSGWSTGFTYERLQAMKFNPEDWIQRLTIGVEADRSRNQVRNATTWGFELEASWSMIRRWRLDNLLPNLTVGLGPILDIYGGALYNPRNGNNPVAAKAAATIGATGYAAWNLRIGRLSLTLRYQPTLPVTGAFFSPDYGELYYEIYLGNHSGLAHWGWWGNYFAMDNLLTADLHFGATMLRLGYSGSILSTKVNDITSRIVTHRFVLGVSGEWISLSPGKSRMAERARIISALY